MQRPSNVESDARPTAPVVGARDRAEPGFAACGRGFYVWAETEAELRDWLTVLAPAATPVTKRSR